MSVVEPNNGGFGSLTIDEEQSLPDHFGGDYSSEVDLGYLIEQYNFEIDHDLDYGSFNNQSSALLFNRLFTEAAKDVLNIGGSDNQVNRFGVNCETRTESEPLPDEIWNVTSGDYSGLTVRSYHNCISDSGTHPVTSSAVLIGPEDAVKGFLGEDDSNDLYDLNDYFDSLDFSEEVREAFRESLDIEGDFEDLRELYGDDINIEQENLDEVEIFGVKVPVKSWKIENPPC